MLLKDVIEKYMLAKNLYIQYVGFIVCCGILMKLYVGISANKQKSFHQHTECHIQYMIYLFAVEYAS